MPKPHEVLLDWATDESREFLDVVIDKETGEPRDIQRRLTVAERIGILKGIAHFYAPALKSVEAKAVVELDDLSLDDLKAKAMTLLAKTIKDEKRTH